MSEALLETLDDGSVTNAPLFATFFGLPDSVLQETGKTIALLSALQIKGLNRDVKRKFAASPDMKGDERAAGALSVLPDCCSDTDRRLICQFANPYRRFGYFWQAMQHVKSGNIRFNAQIYCRAIELLWFEDYASDWMYEKFDDESMQSSCNVWIDIRDQLLKRFRGNGTEKLDFRAFMIWPRIVQDLSNWSNIEPPRRLIVGRAAFALSTISLSHWFLRESVRICPEVAMDFSWLPEIIDQSAGHHDEFKNDEEESSDIWPELLQRLDDLATELRKAPTQATVASLQALTLDFCAVAHTLSVGGKSAREMLIEKVSGAIGMCRQLSQDPDFLWLDESILEQIEARWYLALINEGDGSADILEDISKAPSRIELASQSLRKLFAEKQTVENSIARKGEEINGAKTVGERRALEQQRRETQKELIALDDTVSTNQDDLLAAGSPYGRVFDYAIDYQALLRSARNSESAPAPFVQPEPEAESVPGDIENEAVPAVTGFNSPVELPAMLDAKLLENSDTFDSTDIDVQLSPMVELKTLVVPSVEIIAKAPEPVPVPSEFTGESKATVNSQVPLTFRDEVYNDRAGEICQPIWRLLADGHYSMASQLVRAISSQEDAPQMPPLTLVEALAIADSLTLPDGNLHDALAERLQAVSEEWFQDESFGSWHTALNLLLVAATLRPMVLIPDSGASVIAGYLHLDSQRRYPDLWNLIGSIRESSERLRGFRIELASLRSARDEAANKSDLQSLQQEVRIWLKKQAPAITIKFAPATKVWSRWLQPDGIIHQLLSPLIENDFTQVSKVDSLIREISDTQSFQRLVKKTDRTDNERKKGDDIHSGALDHLGRCCEEAIAYVRRWRSLSASAPHSNDRMKELLLQIRTNVTQLRPSVLRELTQVETGRWQLVACAQKAVLRQIDGLAEIFDPNSPLAVSEANAAEVLARDLLCVPSIRVAPNWTVESPLQGAIIAMRDWCSTPISWSDAFDSRVNSGDLPGAKCLLSRRDDEAEERGLHDLLKRETENWRAKLKSRVADCRRDIEVGSAYGYVSDSERNQCERELVLIEAQTEDSPRFDVAIESIERIRERISTNRSEKAASIKLAVLELKSAQKKPEDIQAVQSSLDEGDMATANELVQRVRSGLPAWPEEAKTEDAFHAFSRGFTEIEGWLSSRPTPVDIQAAIKNGVIPGLDFGNVAGAQRAQAATMFADWTYLKSRKSGDVIKLHSLVSSLGFISGLPPVPVRQENAPGKETWMFSSEPISDRKICPTPHFGSAAKGAYRLICLWERPIEDDIVQLVGDSNLHRATIVLYFGRMTERKWRDLSRKTKLARKSFLLLDETLLLFLSAQAGSRLSALFSTSLPYSYSDPFDATAGFVPPEMFYGRSDELNAILGLNGRCFIYGGRQLGKTALMRRAEQTFQSPDKGRWSYYIDLRAEGIGVNRTASEVWSTIAAAMKAVGMLSEVPTAADLAKKTGIDTLLKTISEFLGKSDERRMLLLLDEADRFFEQDGRHDFVETRRLKQLMDETQRRFKVIFAGLHNVLRMTERANHPLAHFGQPIKIGPFIEEPEIKEARELIRLPLASAGFEFESRSLDMRILAQTNYYPSLIQLYCNHLLQHMLKRVGAVQRLAGPRYKISNHDIEAVYSSSDLRGEIRAKFNFTLQLDPRYEVIAYGMAYEALGGRFGHADGMEWRSIWVDCALNWWAEGFRDTSELDFKVLLDEMVELGVLSRFQSGRYGLRNPNVFLLLGNKDEIETVLARNRHPAVEFDSAVFHPQLRTKGSGHLRHPLTFQQLSEILKHKNIVTAIAGIPAADINALGKCLKGFVEQSGAGVCHIVDGVSDQQTFVVTLKDLVEERDMKGHTIIVVPISVPWSGLWVKAAKEKLAHLRSLTGYVSICFIADPNTLWGTLSDDKFVELDIPWITLLPWRETFVRQYLEDQQLTTTPELIRAATGYWPALLYPLIDKCTQVRDLERNARAAKEMLEDRQEAERLLPVFGLNVAVTKPVLSTMAEFGQGSEAADLSELSDVPIETVDRVLAWGELLGIVRREGVNHWRLDEVVEQLFLSVRD